MQDLTYDITVAHLKRAYVLTYSQLGGMKPSLDRLQRAMDMLTHFEQYSFHIHGGSGMYPTGVYTVTSPNGIYTVDETTQECTCPDGALLCKHRLAIRLITMAKRLQLADGMLVADYRPDLEPAIYKE